jgi:hypothetical protein
MSTNNLTLDITASRASVNRGDHRLVRATTIEDLSGFLALEVKVVAAAVAFPVSFGSITTASTVLLRASRALGIQLNADTESVITASTLDLIDASVTALYLTNEGTTDIDVEIWVAAGS